MSAERLRRAANRVDGEEDGYWPADITLWLATTGTDKREIDAGPLVVLLRVIGSRKHHGDDDGKCWDCWRPLWAGHEADCIVGAAKALVDAILGEEA